MWRRWVSSWVVLVHGMANQPLLINALMAPVYLQDRVYWLLFTICHAMVGRRAVICTGVENNASLINTNVLVQDANFASVLCLLIGAHAHVLGHL